MRLATHPRSLPIILGALAGALLTPSFAEAKPKKPKLQPEADWRLLIKPEQVSSPDSGTKELKGLYNDEGKDWEPAGDGVVTLDFDFSDKPAKYLLMVVELKGHSEDPVPLGLGGGKGGKSKFKTLSVMEVERRHKDRRKGPRTAHLTVPCSKYPNIRLMLGKKDAQKPVITRIRLYKLDKKSKNNYWVFVGSGITTGALDPWAFTQEVKKQFKGFEPYAINEGISGMGIRRLKSSIASILKKHPHSRYIAIHIGGVNVSQSRPFPTGSKQMRTDLEATLKTIIKAGKIPILARLSYRHYKEGKGKPAVPPESNGSGPYVENIFDPLIRKYCPHFYDKKARRGTVDIYGFFKARKDLLDDSGVMPKGDAHASWRKIWINGAAEVVYNGEAKATEPGKAEEKKKEGGDQSPAKGNSPTKE